jgi:hypothetical protein
MFVFCPFVGKKRKLYILKRTKRTCPSIMNLNYSHGPASRIPLPHCPHHITCLLSSLICFPALFLPLFLTAPQPHFCTSRCPPSFVSFLTSCTYHDYHPPPPRRPRPNCHRFYPFFHVARLVVNTFIKKLGGGEEYGPCVHARVHCCIVSHWKYTGIYTIAILIDGSGGQVTFKK